MDIDFKSVDLYELFDVSPESTETEIKKAYRKKALIYHPDKNPDDPKANEVFQKLSKALEVLTDKEARTSYDKILNAKKEREIKNRKLDAKRRKLKDELDAQEKFNSEISIRVEEDKLKQEIERIRKEGYAFVDCDNLSLNFYYCFLDPDNLKMRITFSKRKSNNNELRKVNKLVQIESKSSEKENHF